MPYVIIKKGTYFKIKNTTTGRIHKNNFKDKKNAEIQVKNRLRFEKMIKKQLPKDISIKPKQN